MQLIPGRNPISVSRLMNSPQMSGLGNHIYFIHIAYRALDAGDRMYGVAKSPSDSPQNVRWGRATPAPAGDRRSSAMPEKYHPAPLLAPDRPPGPDSTGTASPVLPPRRHHRRTKKLGVRIVEISPSSHMGGKGHGQTKPRRVRDSPLIDVRDGLPVKAENAVGKPRVGKVCVAAAPAVGGGNPKVRHGTTPRDAAHSP